MKRLEQSKPEQRRLPCPSVFFPSIPPVEEREMGEVDGTRVDSSVEQTRIQQQTHHYARVDQNRVSFPALCFTPCSAPKKQGIREEVEERWKTKEVYQTTPSLSIHCPRNLTPKLKGAGGRTGRLDQNMISIRFLSFRFISVHPASIPSNSLPLRAILFLFYPSGRMSKAKGEEIRQRKQIDQTRLHQS